MSAVADNIREDHQLLADYMQSKSEAAFRELVTRHAPWLFAAARRQLWDPHLAQDAAQVVFIVLAQKACDMKPASQKRLTG